MPRPVLLLSVLALSACFIGDPDPVELAENRIEADLAVLFPGIDTGPATECVVSQATEQEIAVLSGGAEGTQALTLDIFERPLTLACLQANGVIALETP